MLTFTKNQMEAVFTLLLQQKSEFDIAITTGYPLHLVKFIIKSNRKRFADRIRARQRVLESRLNPAKEREEAECRDMVDAIREILGKEPLYAAEEESSEQQKEQARHRWHTKVKLQKAKKQQADQIKEKLK